LVETIYDYVISKKLELVKPTIIVGGIKSTTIKAIDLTIIGRVQVNGTISADKLTVIGHGLASTIEVKEAYLIANGPLFIDVLKANKALIIGRRGSIIADFIEADTLFMERSYASRIVVQTLKLSWGVGIRILENAREIVFYDPHVWFEEIRAENPAITYKYSIQKLSSAPQRLSREDS